VEEAAAREWLEQELGVSRETFRSLDDFIALLRKENKAQNLVSHATLDQVWNRHILDSAQLLRFAPPELGAWVDLGTGAGFPGLIVAALYPGGVTMVEARKLRVDFLRRAAEVLRLPSSTRIICAKVERLEDSPFGVSFRPGRTVRLAKDSLGPAEGQKCEVRTGRSACFMAG
jgi:16S rRNA (guanine527-N7)-methyltransferase